VAEQGCLLSSYTG